MLIIEPNNESIQTLLTGRGALRPKADPVLCTGCGTCIDHCSVSALSMSGEEIPVVDADSCITCFCCREMCPEKAMALT